MNVQTFAKQVGLNAHTLRYYEKIGLLTSVKRRTNGHRYFDEADVRWISFILRLKETGMALTDMVQYAQLRATGDATLAQRQALLSQHARQLQAEIASKQQDLAKLQDKIAWYDSLLEKQAGSANTFTSPKQAT